MRFSSLLPFSLLALATRGNGYHLQLSGRLESTSPALQRRTSMTGTLSQLNDTQNMVYTANVTLNGKQFCVMIDTGSSDLWVSSSVPGAVSQNYEAGVTYASGSASGTVMSATFGFAGFSIEEQFFIVAPDGDAAAGADGLIGLGPASSSSIRAEGKSDAANPPLDRIFTSDSSVSPLIAVLLQRSDDPDEPYPGDLAVGEVLTDYKDILNQPQLPVTIAPLQGGQHWQTLLDVNGIIGSDGKQIEIKTQVTDAQTENATVIFDTGFTLPQVHPDVAQALYGNIPGASLQNVSELGSIWVLDCSQEVNATFLFGGVEFPIHPLDLNFDGFGLQDDNGNSLCVGAFQPYSFDVEEDGDILFDMILGMAFLRNSYMVINFGNLVNAATPSTDTAYIQLLPITNVTEAAKDFAKVRGGGGGSTGTGTGSQLSGSGHSSSSKSSPKTWVIGLIAGIGVLLALLVGGVFSCCRRWRRRTSNSLAPNAVWPVNTPSYRPIHEPSPQAAYDMHMAPGAPPSYAPTYAGEYRTAWDARY